MNIYKLLKLNNSIKSHRIKFFGLFLLNIFQKRILSVQLDTVMGCNLKCKMCYFSDPEYVRQMPKGIFSENDLSLIAKAVFKNAIKLQIGCGTEPTLFKHNSKLIELAKSYQVPYISMVTNGILLSKLDINNFVKAGIDEFILSMHGVSKETYEEFMTNSSYDKFLNVLDNISEAKKINKNLKLRINYTFNADNFLELEHFFETFGKYSIDVIQLRPIDKIGESKYDNFNLESLQSLYISTTNRLHLECKKRGITLLYPNSIIRNQENSLVVESTINSSYLMPYTYCYVSPYRFWKEDFDWRNETYIQWCKRNNWNSILFKNIFKSSKNLFKPNRNMLNYEVKINN